MIAEHRDPLDAATATPSDAASARQTAGHVSVAPSAPPAPARDGEIQETVDPFDYAESIVRDLALHVGSRLRDFRADLTAMHSAVVALPETMRINALGQSIQELRERVAHLTGVVSQQVTKAQSEETEKLSRGLAELMQRVGGLEAWIASARRASDEDGPVLPLPSGGIVGMEQFDQVIDQVHESIVKVVGVIRDIQLDIRDIRTEVRDWANVPALREAKSASDGASNPALIPAASAIPESVAADLRTVMDRLDRLETAQSKAVPPAPPAIPATVAADLRAVMDRLDRLEKAEPKVRPSAAPTIPESVTADLRALTDRLDRLEKAEPKAAPSAAPVNRDGATDLASLLFGAWDRLSQPRATDPLRTTLNEVIARFAPQLGQIVRLPECPGGSGLSAVGIGHAGSTELVALFAVEDLGGETWTLNSGSTEMVALGSGATRAPAWRTLLLMAALVESTRPNAAVKPVLVYGNGRLSALPGKDEIAEFGRSIGAAAAAERLHVAMADASVTVSA